MLKDEYPVPYYVVCVLGKQSKQFLLKFIRLCEKTPFSDATCLAYSLRFNLGDVLKFKGSRTKFLKMAKKLSRSYDTCGGGHDDPILDSLWKERIHATTN